MKKNSAIMLAGAAVVAVALVGGFVYFRNSTPQRAAIPPLPAGTRNFDKWALVGCGEAKKGLCTLMLRVVNEKAERVVLRFNVLRARTGHSILVVTLPPSVVIPAGVTLTPAGGKAAKAAVRICRPRTCTAIAILDDALIKELSSADTTNVEFVAGNGRKVSLNLPMQGFARGFAAWQAAAPPPTANPKPAANANGAKGSAGGAKAAAPKK